LSFLIHSITAAFLLRVLRVLIPPLIMTVSIELPSEYGYVILSCVVCPFVSSFLIGGSVMAARKSFDVQYPNLYATPGFHKQADAFNRVQRGHQSIFESLGCFIPAALIGGSKYPLFVSVSGIFYCVGSYLYMAGYADTKLDVDKARHMKGGPIRFLGLFYGGWILCISGWIYDWMVEIGKRSRSEASTFSSAWIDGNNVCFR
jgi:glutathione S-transferase